MSRVLFVIPPYVTYENFVSPGYNEGTMQKRTGSYRNLVADMPIGILSLSAYLKKHTGAEVRLVDFNIVLRKLEGFTYGSFAELFREVLAAPEWAAFRPDLVGISTLFTPAYQNMLDLAETARALFPSAFVTAGGGVPTNVYRETFRDTRAFDALCFGEGEKPLVGLLQAADRAAYLAGDPAWITPEKVARGESFRHDFVEDLDEIPCYDYGLLDLDDYRLSPVLSAFPLAREKARSISIMTSRGCTHRCSFCASFSVHGRRMRYHSLARVREDFRRLQDEYGATSMIFFDDHLMADRQRVFAIVDILNELGLTAFFPNSLALYALDRKVLEALRSVGLNQLVLSVESGSNRVLKKIMHKPLDLSIVQRVIRDCRELGISADVAVMIGLPGETKEDIEDARAFFKTLDATWFRINVATPLVGSEMLEICLEKHYLKGSYIGADFKKAVVETEDFTAEYIQEKAYALNLELNFVLNSDYRLGNHAVALQGFENTLRVKGDHAFAHYYAALACRQLGREEEYREHRARYAQILGESAFWREYATRFGLADLD